MSASLRLTKGYVPLALAMSVLSDYARLVASQAQSSIPKSAKDKALEGAWRHFYDTGRWPNARWQIQGAPLPCKYMGEAAATSELKRLRAMARAGQLGESKETDLFVECMIPPRPKEATTFAWEAYRSNAESCPVCPALLRQPCIDSSGKHIDMHVHRKRTEPRK